MKSRSGRTSPTAPAIPKAQTKRLVLVLLCLVALVAGAFQLRKVATAQQDAVKPHAATAVANSQAATTDAKGTTTAIAASPAKGSAAGPSNIHAGAAAG